MKELLISDIMAFEGLIMEINRYRDTLATIACANRKPFTDLPDIAFDAIKVGSSHNAVCSCWACCRIREDV